MLRTLPRCQSVAMACKLGIHARIAGYLPLISARSNHASSVSHWSTFGSTVRFCCEQRNRRWRVQRAESSANCGESVSALSIGLENDLWLALHLMIAGRLHWQATGSKAGRPSNSGGFRLSQWFAGAYRSRHKTPRLVAYAPRRGSLRSIDAGRNRHFFQRSQFVSCDARRRKPHTEAGADGSSSAERFWQRVFR